MKKTCLNCKHFHSVLASPDKNDQYNIHKYCDMWHKCLAHPLNSRLCEFLAYELFDRGSGGCKIECAGIYDDIEAGEAGCYMFNPRTNGCDFDEEMRRNFNENKETAIRLIDYLVDNLEKSEDDDEYHLYMRCRDDFENMRYEDRND